MKFNLNTFEETRIKEWTGAENSFYILFFDYNGVVAPLNDMTDNPEWKHYNMNQPLPEEQEE